MKKRKAFTLIELVSVLVILAILALIVTPLVLNIIRKARIAADKRSIDAYGRSIELAIADYLLENGTFPTSIDELTIEYSGDRVMCAQAKLKSDSSIYLASCTVNNRTVDYTYGTEEIITYRAYEIGDVIEYKGINFYVIKESGTTDTTVTLLKSEPLTADEIEEAGGTRREYEGYGREYYQFSDNSHRDYTTSNIKSIVDSWATNKLGSNGYEEARLITFDDLINDLGYEYYVEGTETGYKRTEDTPDWLYISNSAYWTMSLYDDSYTQEKWYIISDYDKLTWSANTGKRVDNGPYPSYYGYPIRPVITISKSAL